MSLKLILGSTIMVTLCACTKREIGPGSSGSVPPKKEFVLKGDPELMLTGTKGNPESPILEAEVDRWQGWTLSASSQFAQKKEGSSAPAKAEPPEKTSPSAVSSSFIAKDASGTWIMHEADGSSFFKMERTRGGRLQPVAVWDKDGRRFITIKPIHWSVSSDGAYATFLFSAHDKVSGNVIVEVLLVQNRARLALPTLDKQYAYLQGNGVPLRWQGDEVTLQVCRADMIPLMQKMAALWNEALGGRFQVKVFGSEFPAPFSDLNQHCVYFVDAELDNSVIGGALMTTLTKVDLFQGQIIDADVILFKDAITKYKSALVTRGLKGEDLSRAVRHEVALGALHELGHFLGLGHQKDVPSIMHPNAENMPLTLTPYDREAIELLYMPRPTPLVESGGLAP